MHNKLIPESKPSSFFERHGRSTYLIFAAVLTAYALPLILTTTPAAAQTGDGNIGSISSGQVELGIEVLDSVQVSALDSLDFGTYGGSDSGGLNLGDAFCVYVNGGDQYTITLTSANSAFKLIGTTFANEIDYVVRFNGAADGAESAPQTLYSATSSPFSGSQVLDCNSVNNASIDLSISEQAIRDASTDTYADTLILVVNPI